MSTIYSRVGGVGSAPSSRLTAGYLHTCSVKERRAGGGSEVECMELKLHFTAVGPSRPLILFKEVLSFNLSWTDEAGSSTWREEVEFTAVECETYYLISPRPLGSPPEGETLWSLTARADDEGKVSVSLNESRRRWGSRFWKQRWSAVVSSRGETQKLCSGFVSSNSFINLRVFFYSYLFCYDVAKNTKTISVSLIRVQIPTDGVYLLIISRPACVRLRFIRRTHQIHHVERFERFSWWKSCKSVGWRSCKQ